MNVLLFDLKQGLKIRIQINYQIELVSNPTDNIRTDH